LTFFFGFMLPLAMIGSFPKGPPAIRQHGDHRGRWSEAYVVSNSDVTPAGSPRQAGRPSTAER
jgi:hypothetical protein